METHDNVRASARVSNRGGQGDQDSTKIGRRPVATLPDSENMPRQQGSGEPARGSIAWLEQMEHRSGETNTGPLNQQTIGSKRMRAQSYQEASRTSVLAQDKTDDIEAERELIADLPEDISERIDHGFPRATMQVCFSMNERFVSVSDTCDWRLVDFTPEIIEYCSQHGVQFQESELILEVKDQQYLKGSPLRQNRELWQLMKRGYIPFQLSNESEQKIWIQPAYTGLRGSNLSLTELEYSNGNYVSPAQLRTTIQGWGGSDCLVVSHSKYMGEKQRWTPIACMRYAATSLMYSFRLFFPNEEEANTVYKNYLEFARYRQRRRDNPTDTISLRPVQNAEWDVDTASLIRMTRTEIEARTSVRVNVYGVSSEVTPTAIKQAFQRAGAQPDSITINRGRGRSAVATFQSPDQAKSMVDLFGEHGTERLHVGNIALYIAPARPGDCWNCNKSGHFKRDCPLLSNTIKTISPWRSHQPRAENHNNAQLAATNSTDTTAAEALVSRLIDSKINTVTTALTEMTRQCRTANDRCQALEQKFASMEDTWDNRMSRVVELTLAKLQLITAPKEYPATMNHTHTDDDDTMGEATPTPSPISRSQQDFT